MEEANEHRLEEYQHLHCKKVVIDEPLLKEKIAQLKAFLMSKEQDRVQPPIEQAAFIMYVIQGMFAKG